MKHRDNQKYFRSGGRDKYGNMLTNPNSFQKVQERSERKLQNKMRRAFVREMYDIEKHWVKTLTENEMISLHSLWTWNNVLISDTSGSSWHTVEPDDGTFKTLKDFITSKKNSYGNVRKARDLKIEELFQD